MMEEREKQEYSMHRRKKRTVITRLLAKDDSMNPKRYRIFVIVQYEVCRK